MILPAAPLSILFVGVESTTVQSGRAVSISFFRSSKASRIFSAPVKSVPDWQLEISIHLILIYPTEVLRQLIQNDSRLAQIGLSTKFTEQENQHARVSLVSVWQMFLSISPLITW